MLLMLTLDDAIKVAKQLVVDGMDDDEIIRQELEQKCWIAHKTDEPARCLSDLICDINPGTICREIKSDSLSKWCEAIQIAMRMAMVQMRWKGRSDATD